MKSRKNMQSSLGLEKIVGLVTCSFNGLNSQLKRLFDDQSRALFFSHFAQLCQHEAKVVSGPIGDLIGGEADV